MTPRTFAAPRALLRHLLVGLAILVLFEAVGVAAPGGRPLRVQLGSAEALVPSLRHEDGERVSLRALAAALDLELELDVERGFVLTSRGVELVFPAATPGLARIDERIFSLGGSGVVVEGDLLIPSSAVHRVLAHFGQELADREEPDEGGEEPEEVRPGFDRRAIVSIVGGGAQRLYIEIGLPVRPTRVSRGFGPERPIVVEVRGVGGVELPWSSKAIGSDVLERLELRPVVGGFDLLVYPGPGFTALAAGTRPDSAGVRVTLEGREVGLADEGALDPVRRVVIDPGHGGVEDGAIGPGGLKEKDVVLDVARRLAARLEAEGFDTLLTRDGDETLSLDERAAIANSARADLFISVHANASPHRKAHGAETYFLAREATDDEARTLAALENNASGAEVEAASATGELPLILWDMAQAEYLEDSQELAETIQVRLNEALGLRDRGVRQAPFRVLVGATCPAVLVELGFLSNPKEEGQLGDPSHRARLADALRDAIVAYREARRAGVPVARREAP